MNLGAGDSEQNKEPALKAGSFSPLICSDKRSTQPSLQLWVIQGLFSMMEQKKIYQSLKSVGRYEFLFFMLMFSTTARLLVLNYA